MPMFEYKCPDCGQRFEKLISREKADDVCCETCKTKAERQLSAFGVGASTSGSACDAPYCQTPAATRTGGGCHGGMCGM